MDVTDKQLTDATASFKFKLRNEGEGSSTETNGVMMEFTNVDITNLDLGSFDRCATGSGSVPVCDENSDMPTDVIELYVDGDTATSGVITAEYTGDPQTAGINYRGWIYDENDMALNPYPYNDKEDQDDGDSAVYERYVSRYPSEDLSAVPEPDNPSTYDPSNNPPYKRAARNASFSFTEYETTSTTLSPTETTVAASPETWDIGSTLNSETRERSITIENTGSVGTSISVSGGSGLSTSGVPSELDAGQSASFTVTLDADNYNGDSIVISYAGGEVIIPISVTVVDDEDLIVEESESIEDFDGCSFLHFDVWGSSIACNDNYGNDWEDEVNLGEEVMAGFTDATLYVDFSTSQEEDEPLEVYVNGERVASLQSPSSDSSRTESIPLSESNLKQGDNQIRFTTSGVTTYGIGGGTRLEYSYFEAPQLDLSFGQYPKEVEPGTTFLLPVKVENEGGQSAEGVWLGFDELDDSLEQVSYPEGWGIGSSRTLEPGEMDVGYFEFRLTERALAGGEIATGADNVDFIDRSFTVEVPNDPPTLDSFSVSPEDVYPNEQVTYTASVTDPDGDNVDVTLEVYIPSDGSWQTYGTQTVSGSGTVQFDVSPFSGDDIGKTAEFRFDYSDGFGGNGKWGSFIGPSISDPNTESPSFDDWTYPTEIQPTDDVDVSADISDPDGVASAKIRYTYPNGTEEEKSMSQAGSTWSATIPAPTENNTDGQISFVVSATDDNDFQKTSKSVTRYITINILSPVNGFDSPPQDLNGDGLYRDINGDGSFNLGDVIALYDNYGDDPVLNNNPELFNFNDQENPDDVTLGDVIALYNEL